MTTPIPRAAIDASAPTSRSTFRLIARCVDATNRDADTLRHALLAQWSENDGTHALERQLLQLDRSDPDGSQGLESRLAVWFTFSDPDDGRLVAPDAPVLDGISDDFRDRLSGIAHP